MKRNKKLLSIVLLACGVFFSSNTMEHGVDSFGGMSINEEDLLSYVYFGKRDRENPFSRTIVFRYSKGAFYYQSDVHALSERNLKEIEKGNAVYVPAYGADQNIRLMNAIVVGCCSALSKEACKHDLYIAATYETLKKSGFKKRASLDHARIVWPQK